MTSADEAAARAAAKKVRDVDRGVDQHVSRSIELSSSFVFTEVLGFDVEPTTRGGIIRVVANFTDGKVAVDYQYALVEIRVVGYVGSKQESLHRAALGRESGAIDVVVDGAAAYQRLAVFGVYSVDGGAPGPTGSFGSASVSAIARMNRT